MKVFLDERCLAASGCDLAALLGSWREIVDFARENAPGVTVLLDQHATRQPQFLQRFNQLPLGRRVLFTPITFGNETVVNWRDLSVANGCICQVATESAPLQDCAFCEVYEHRQLSTTNAILGDHASSYGHLTEVAVSKIVPPGPPAQVVCGQSLTDFRRIGIGWNCIAIHYDPASDRTPRDYETVLTRFPNRFTRLKRIERNGRRHVYREHATGRLFYVDNLHDGGGAHLEVFDADECHLGIADLEGNLKPDTQKPGRRISW